MQPPVSNLAMSQLGTVYATKRRRRNGKSLKPPPKDGVTKSNPSKRHRERLNAELDTLANLLPFEQNILSKLDRLSILRLSVSYLRTKSYFQVTMHKMKEENQYRGRSDVGIYEHALLDGDMFLQALNGFLVILTCEGEVFFATHSIESYLGFHQSDIVHQSVYELVHSEDREELQRQLMWNSFLPPESSGISLQDALLPDQSHLLERSFTVRFRCLLDNTSGFLRLDIRGRIKVLHGQNRKTEEPPLALFAVCTPFGPPSLLETPHKEVMFKSKHKLDLSLVSMDQRGKLLLGYSDAELANAGGYHLVHYDDMAYVASAHQELLKTGASGMIAYRLQTKEGRWQWLQTSSRLVYKNSKPDFVMSTHRPLMEEEGRDLLGKRTMDFKVSYLDAGLTSSYFTDSEQLLSSTPPHHPSTSPSSMHSSTGAAATSSATPTPPTPQKVNRRYKTQLRDFLSTCRTKRKLTTHHPTPVAPPIAAAAAPTPVDYLTTAPVAVAYNMYSSGYSPTTTDTTLYGGHSGVSNFHHQSLYENRLPYLASDNLFHQYRPYYSDYHSATPYVSNGFLDISTRSATCMPTYESAPHHQLKGNDWVDQKYASVVDNSCSYIGNKLDVGSPYMAPNLQLTVPLCDLQRKPKSDRLPTPNSAGSSPAAVNGIVTPKMEEMKPAVDLLQHHYSPVSEAPRQTVLMWGSTPRSPAGSGSNPGTPPVLNGQTYLGQEKGGSDPLKSLAEMDTKWKAEESSNSAPTPAPAHAPAPAPPSPAKCYQYASESGATEVWPTPHHQFYSYHHHHPAASEFGNPQINRTGVLCCPSRR
ncbi:aryl hydrocarbon receptor protein 1 isoform X1 [Bemisia tabaci]|uniref:aryl hydrocarbon receptor protein 1 isoform X1 n=1 Tax=Bemisia tabaci TaxID=7038 RepID=UPI003B280422